MSQLVLKHRTILTNQTSKAEMVKLLRPGPKHLPAKAAWLLLGNNQLEQMILVSHVCCQDLFQFTVKGQLTRTFELLTIQCILDLLVNYA